MNSATHSSVQVGPYNAARNHNVKLMSYLHSFSFNNHQYNSWSIRLRCTTCFRIPTAFNAIMIYRFIISRGRQNAARGKL